MIEPLQTPNLLELTFQALGSIVDMLKSFDVTLYFFGSAVPDNFHISLWQIMIALLVLDLLLDILAPSSLDDE